MLFMLGFESIAQAANEDQQLTICMKVSANVLLRLLLR
jgi:hypothetical protein